MTALQWYQWMALAALVFCLALLLAHFIRLVQLGKPIEYSRQAGDTGRAIRYAYSGAMNPARKESAYLHLPTYLAGLIYHLGTFLSLFLFFFILSGRMPTGWLGKIIIVLLFISAGSGTAIFIKRVVNRELRSLSNPDDFISNFLVTLFQISTIVIILLPLYNPASPLPSLPTSYSLTFLPSYYLIFTILMLYIPMGKLRHTLYFFAARYHLGYFFGWRGVWPHGNLKK